MGAFFWVSRQHILPSLPRPLTPPPTIITTTAPSSTIPQALKPSAGTRAGAAKGAVKGASDKTAAGAAAGKPNARSPPPPTQQQQQQQGAKGVDAREGFSKMFF